MLVLKIGFISNWKTISVQQIIDSLADFKKEMNLNKNNGLRFLENNPSQAARPLDPLKTLPHFSSSVFIKIAIMISGDMMAKRNV